MTVGTWALILLTAASFAVSLPFNKYLVGDIPPVTLSAVRAILALPLMWAIAIGFRAGLPRSVRDWSASLIGAVLIIAVPFTAIAFGQQYIPSGLGGILYASMPLMTVIIASFVISDEQLTSLKMLGCLVGLAGVTTIIGPSALRGFSEDLLGVLGTLVAPLSYATGTVILRKLPASNPLVLTSGMFLIATILLIPMALITEGQPDLSVASTRILPLLGLASLGTAAPAFLNYVLIRRAGATNASLVMFIMPIFAIAFGAALFDERIPLPAIAGMILTIAGCFMVTRRNA